MIENHDSFSYNIVDYLKRISPSVEVRSHLETPELTGITHLILGPGPGSPKTSGLLMQWLDAAVKAEIPTLGICLGHQAIGEYFGANLMRASRAIHGEAHAITHCGDRLFKGLANPTRAARYHSLILANLGPSLRIDAWTGDGEIMAISHVQLPMLGVQFHPESFLSEQGLELLNNFYQLYA